MFSGKSKGNIRKNWVRLQLLFRNLSPHLIKNDKYYSLKISGKMELKPNQVFSQQCVDVNVCIEKIIKVTLRKISG